MSSASLLYFPAIRARRYSEVKDKQPCRVTAFHETWPAFWREVARSLTACGYQISTLIFYRHIIRTFSRFVGKPPNQVTQSDVKSYLLSLAGKSYTWHWTGMNISVLRTVFDKLSGLSTLDNQRGPRRKRSLPEFLSRNEIDRMLGAATTLRDQLIIGLLYGCGLKVGELRQIRWRDIQPNEGILCLSSRYDQRIRRLKLPKAIVPILQEGISRCDPDHLVFAGAKVNCPLSARAVQNVVSRCARVASLPPNITPQILRNSYAVHALESGASIRQVQDQLDHQYVETTLRYEACLPSPHKHNPVASIERTPESAAPHETVSTSHIPNLLNASSFPMTDPQTLFLSNLKVQINTRFLALRRYFNSG